ncbi:helix-turn-helix domain-containing protein, partial [Candidatus Woesearchaeota archaeon]|nr:helix-turn-helix domain-containing protein [Candidatus Woesearchaeota archaeon]
VSIFLLRKGFTLKNLTRTCFDILARRNEQILLIKVLEDANSISREYSEEMIAIASYINASPLIISEKAGNKLEDNIVYSRFEIYTLNLATFTNSIHNRFPFIKRSKAGLTASVSGKKLREKREELGFSLNALSKKVGVTSRMMVKYENENSEITINRAMKLYDLLGHDVFNEVNVFSQCMHPRSRFETEVSKKYIELGFDATETRKTPFDIIAKKDDEIILTEVSDKVNPQMQSLSKLLEVDNLVIFHKKKPKNMPSMTKKEFMDFDRANELVRFLREF